MWWLKRHNIWGEENLNLMTQHNCYIYDIHKDCELADNCVILFVCFVFSVVSVNSATISTEMNIVWILPWSLQRWIQCELCHDLHRDEYSVNSTTISAEMNTVLILPWFLQRWIQCDVLVLHGIFGVTSVRAMWQTNSFSLWKRDFWLPCAFMSGHILDHDEHYVGFRAHFGKAPLSRQNLLKWEKKVFSAGCVKDMLQRRRAST